MTAGKIGGQLFDFGSQGAGTITPQISQGNYFRVTCAAATLTIANPIVGRKVDLGATVDVPLTTGAGPEPGDILIFEVKNASGGAVTLTWGALFKLPVSAPANGQRRVVMFLWDGASLSLIGTPIDVPN